MTQERKGAATVIAQEESRVEVEYEGEHLTVPLVGFPPDFRLRPGERVILVDEPTGPVARPLVRAIVSRLPDEAREQRGEVEIEGRRLVMQSSTVLEPDVREEGRPSEEHVLWIIEPGEAEGPDQVVAARRRR